MEVPFARKKGAAQTRENLPLHYVQLLLAFIYREPCSLQSMIMVARQDTFGLKASRHPRARLCPTPRIFLRCLTPEATQARCKGD